jgi:hypothetical protein
MLRLLGEGTQEKIVGIQISASFSDFQLADAKYEKILF